VTSDYYVHQEDFENAYRVSFICGCINERTSEKFSNFLLDSDDSGLFSASGIISHELVREADSLGRVYSQKIKPINYSDAGFRKPIFSNCVFYAFSKEVKMTIRLRYKELIKSLEKGF
jgi:hypothetical protein